MVLHEVLIVDDEDSICELISEVLLDEGYQVRTASDSTETLNALQERCPSIVLLDIWLHGSKLDGMELLEEIQKKYPALPVIIMSGHGNIEIAVSAIQLGAADFIEKPFKINRLILSLKSTLELARLKRENEEFRSQSNVSDILIGESSAIRHMNQLIRKVADSNSRILITGAPGTGKEAVARLIHDISSRAKNPFVIVNCATMESADIEMILFGDDRHGQEKENWDSLKKAHGGTLLLDQISDMPMETQGKILRALQDETFERIGSDLRARYNVRIISASCHNLREKVSQKKFREDLFYRLNVVPLEVPSLSSRREDIPLLANYFMKRCVQSLGQAELSISDKAMVVLQSYYWPGNIRELRNVVERMIIMAAQDYTTIDLDLVPSEVINAKGTKNTWEGVDPSLLALPLKEAREIFERNYLMVQLERFNHNISRVSKFIGMERSALHRKLKNLDTANDNRK